MYLRIELDSLTNKIHGHAFSSAIWGRRFSTMRWLFGKGTTN